MLGTHRPPGSRHRRPRRRWCLRRAQREPCELRVFPAGGRTRGVGPSRAIPGPTPLSGAGSGQGASRPGLTSRNVHGRGDSGTVSITPATDGCHGLFLMPVGVMTHRPSGTAMATQRLTGGGSLVVEPSSGVARPTSWNRAVNPSHRSRRPGDAKADPRRAEPAAALNQPRTRRNATRRSDCPKQSGVRPATGYPRRPARRLARSAVRPATRPAGRLVTAGRSCRTRRQCSSWPDRTARRAPLARGRRPSRCVADRHPAGIRARSHRPLCHGCYHATAAA
jgi:hypothetical protein